MAGSIKQVKMQGGGHVSIPDMESVTVNPFTGNAYSARYFDILSKRKELPMWARRDDFFKMVHANQILVLVGETGSGKTTQSGQWLLEYLQHNKEQYSKQNGSARKPSICCTQPRRVAAISVANRVAEEMDVTFGQEVGYTIRFEDFSTKETQVRYLTDGMLLREATFDPALKKYDAIILDEAHERTISTDILMGVLKDILKTRPDLKLIVMSATLDSDKFTKYFFDAPLLQVSGRTYPVEIFYSSKPEPNYIESAVNCAINIHSGEDEGDILIFLNGEDEIEEAVSMLNSEVRKIQSGVGKLLVIPLYSSLAPEAQQRIFSPRPAHVTLQGSSVTLFSRKCIVSTNIAETSLTIDGIVYVIDPGFSKQKVYNPRIRVESLLVTEISQASAKQRAGRAGRTRPGKCFRLYTQQSFYDVLPKNSYPEIQRSNLSVVVLQMLKLGITNLVYFDFMDPPAPEVMMRALETLNYLNIIDDEGALTPLGSFIAEFPLDPQLSKTLVEAYKFSCTREVLMIVAVLSSPNIFVRPKDKASEAKAAKAQFEHPDGDHLSILNAFHCYLENKGNTRWCSANFLNIRSLSSAEKVMQQLIRLLRNHPETRDMDSSELRLNQDATNSAEYMYFTEETYRNVRRAFANGFFMHIAHLDKKREYSTIKDDMPVRLHPSTVLKPGATWVLFNEYVLTSEYYLRTCLKVEPTWLLELAPAYYDLSTFPKSTAAYRSLIRASESAGQPVGKTSHKHHNNDERAVKRHKY